MSTVLSPQAPIEPGAKPPMLGRFELRHQLGKGAQATVWLAFDPRLEREVAVKLMRPLAGTDAAAVHQWLHEARSVSRLTHPNIVPVFEADSHQQQPYLVFEYVPGRTLGEHLRARRGLPAAEAVALMLDVLAALEAAHAAGVIHRDLKPSNILVDGSGRARVMDFGIAARVDVAAARPAAGQTGQVGRGAERLVGTPGYLSPEAAQGAAPTPGMDVFSAGLVLAELLSGQALIRETDAFRAIYRAAHEDLVLPDVLADGCDDALRAVVMRALARDPAQRHASAREFREALQRWASPQADNTGVAAAAASGNSGTLEFLLRRMRHKSDFPGLSSAVARIQKVAGSENESLGSLSAEILKDVALTHKLLRLVNTAHYTHAGGGSISTVSRAVALVGFAGIRNMALSLVLLDHMQDKVHAQQLKEEFVRSLLAGVVAGELMPLGPQARDGEEAFIGAMFQNIGRLLTAFYLPEEAQQIKARMGSTGRSPAREEAAAIHVMGLSFEELGLGVARSWGLPEALQRCMHKPVGEPPARLPDSAADRLRWLTLAANDVADVVLQNDPQQATPALGLVAERYARVLGLSPRQVLDCIDQGRRKMVQMAQAMNLHAPPASALARLLRSPDLPQAPEEDSLTPHQLTALPRDAAGAGPAGSDSPRAQAAAVLAAGIQDITNTMVEDFRLNEVLRMILETMLRALDCRRIVFCLRDARSGQLTGRFGLGEGADQASAVFKVPLDGRNGNDLFGAVCQKGVDTLISDASAANIASRLPAWYQQQLNAPAFLLLPLVMKGSCFALIYAELRVAGQVDIGDKELALLRTLRNQAVMAFKQSG